MAKDTDAKRGYRVLCNTGTFQGDDLILGRSEPDGTWREVARMPLEVYHDKLDSRMPMTVIIRPGDHT
jgi:hypothetical protein